MLSRVKLCFALFIFALLVLFISCDDNSRMNISEVTLVEPIVSESNEKALVSAGLSIDEYKIKMIPAWNEDTQKAYQAYGSTKGKGDGGSDYVVFDPLRMGYYSQGVWWFGLEAYSKGNLVYRVEDKKVDINNFSSSISISPEEIKPVNPNGTSSVNLASFDFLLVDSADNYGTTYYIETEIVPLNSTGNKIGSVVSKDSISFNGNTGVINNWIIATGVGNGAYSVNVSLYENIDGQSTPKRTGTVSCVITSVPGVDIVTSGKENEVDLYPSYYATPGTGTGGIIIDSGINSAVTITSKVGDTNLTTNTVDTNTTVTFTAAVTGATSNISNHIWMVNGVVQQNANTNVFSYQFTENKMYTITYMFTDSIDYNTISNSVYIKVKAPTTTTT